MTLKSQRFDMKKILTLSLLTVMALSACQEKKEQQTQTQQQQQLQDATKEELIQAVTERDELLELMGDITNDVAEVKRLENIMTATDGMQETQDQRVQIQKDITAIQQALQQRRERLSELEAKLSKSTTTNQKLTATIDQLRRQIDEQTGEISRLNASLAVTQSQVAQLTTVNDSLATTVTNVTGELEDAQATNVELTNELNKVYYASGTDKELKAHNIEFKKNILQTGYDQTYFTVADRRTLQTINLMTTKKVELLPARTEGCYQIMTDPQTKNKTLRITNPQQFWNQSQYLVVKIK